jgi:DNA (cytosine-5)-methyltransferase 1
MKMDEWVSRDGIILPAHLAIKPKRPVAIDLFAGCGGMSLGLMTAGWEVLAGVDYDVMAAITYTYNLGAYPMKFVFVEKSDEERMEKELKKQMGVDDKKKTIRKAFTTGQGRKSSSKNGDVPGVGVFIVGDIRKLTGEKILDAVGREIGEVDLVCGSPPCQGFSTAGQREVMDPRNSLVFDFARLVLEISPRTIIMENVPGIISMLTPEGLPVIDVFCNMLEKGNYGDADMLKRSLMVSSGSGAAVKGRKRSKAEKEEPVEVEDSQQMALL